MASITSSDEGAAVETGAAGALVAAIFLRLLVCLLLIYFATRGLDCKHLKYQDTYHINSITGELQ
jgi:hypothetical protein